MKYILKNNIVTNIVVGNPDLDDDMMVIEKERGFGRIGDWYDESNDECKPMKVGYKVLDVNTGLYSWDESKIDEAKNATIANIEHSYAEANKDFEYPENSGNIFEITSSVINTLQRGVNLQDGDAIPCNGGKWDTVDGVEVPFTMGEFKLMYEFGYDVMENNYSNRKTHLSNVDNMSSIQEVVEYDHTTGWK